MGSATKSADQLRIERLIKSETNPEILQILLLETAEENKRLKARLEALENAKAAEAQVTMALEERLRLLRGAMFGRSREERVEASDRARDKSQEAALLFSKAAFPAPQTRDDDQKNKAKGKELDGVPVEHRMTPEDLTKESELRGLANPSGEQWRDTGLYDESVKVQIIERKYVRELHRRYKYKLKEEYLPVDAEKEVIITAPGPEELLAGMNYTTEFVGSVAADKYVSHIPLERQTRQMESLGLKGIKTSTLSRMCFLAAVSLEPLAERIRKELIQTDLALHLDETPWKIQNSKERDGYMWVMSNRYGSYYFFKPTRSGQVLKEKLGDYSGPALTDGYGGYSVLEELGIKQGLCWAHARREFFPLESHDPSVKPILDLIDELFAIEREAETFEQLAELRKERSRPITEKLRELLIEEFPKSRPGSAKRKAIEYTMKRWQGLTFFLEDTRLALSNNEAERTIRHAVMGRKNYYGSGNHEGAKTAAILFTIIESAKKNDIDPRSFLLMSLARAARGEDLETPLAYARRTRQLVS
ncbi:MAG: IS66 family transposase [Bdellovibrionales bacterium]